MNDEVHHLKTICDGCQQSPIRGNRFKCLQCPNYDLCELCQTQGIHEHQIMQYISISTAGERSPRVQCDACMKVIQRPWYKCQQCSEYDLCNRCGIRSIHTQHNFWYISKNLIEVSFPKVRCDSCKNSVQGKWYKCLKYPNYNLCELCITRDEHRHNDFRCILIPSHDVKREDGLVQPNTSQASRVPSCTPRQGGRTHDGADIQDKAARDLHYQLLQVVDENLERDDFERLKADCGRWIKPAQLERITGTPILLWTLEKKGVIEMGDYSELIRLLKLRRLIKLKDQVEQLACKIKEIMFSDK